MIKWWEKHYWTVLMVAVVVWYVVTMFAIFWPLMEER